ncbi:alpha/beta hydrolase [Luteolibacter sp. SL250]|uniref:alpha/beta fold hydrolase n=1 Tax=Luteolibacter sp. SL250 TaxID=2995170 RepID=UPI002270D8CB|nr:alpha/beta hydrolase [Luteolibacter sp. SL250]WAC17884.1 alpha/beta hydrolase [Luteolibacter sp. SL250]
MENNIPKPAHDEQVTLESSALEMTGIPEIPNRAPGALVSVNGAEIYYETFGDGPPLLLIHGGAATIESWFCQIPALAERYKLIVPEARGHGRTPDAGGTIDFRIMAEDFGALLDHLGLTEVDIVGWSDGGVTGLQIAMDRPDLVRKVVAFGTHSRPEGMTDEFRQEIEGATPENFPAILSEGYKALSPDGPEHWPVIFSKLKDMWLTLPAFAEEDLKKVACPVLLLVGETDIVRREESGRMEELIPAARLRILEGVSHFAPVEAPEAFNHAVLDFLAE